MSIRRLVMLAAIAALGLLALVSATASAATTLRSDPGGLPLNATVTIKNTTSDPMVWTTQAGNIVCSQTFFDADVSTRSTTSLSGRLTTLTFTGCTDTLLAVNFLSCNLHAASTPSVSIASTATGGNITWGHTVVRCATSTAGVACYLTVSAPAGTAVNATSTIRFPNVSAIAVAPTTDAAPVGNCGSTGTLSVTMTHIVTAANQTVTVTQS